MNGNSIHRLITRHIGWHPAHCRKASKYLTLAVKWKRPPFGLMRAKDATAPDISGEVKIAVTEGAGTFWLAPRLVELQRAYPKLLVNLKCAMSPADVSNLEADLAVQLVRAELSGIESRAVRFLHTMPFAAQSYINTYGLPTSLEELKTHRLVLHVAEQTQHKALFAQFAGRTCRWIGTVALTDKRRQRASVGRGQGRRDRLAAHLYAFHRGSDRPDRDLDRVLSGIFG